MEFPSLYRKVAFLPKRDFNVALEEFTLKNQWKKNATIFDVGSGDGSTTKEILQKCSPPDYEKIIGCDISGKMVAYANEHFGNEKMEFLEFDITDKLLPHLKAAFDHAFSSYVLHRIKQQRAAFTNIYDSLKYGGSCLHIILGRYPVFENFRILSRKEKWAEDLKDVEEFISPYHDSEDPKKEVSSLMESIGFKEVEVNIFEKTHTYSDVNTFKSLVKSINPFHSLDDKWDEFMADYFELVPNAIKIDYQLIVAYGVKLS